MEGGTNQAWADQRLEFYYAAVGEMLQQGLKDTAIGRIAGVTSVACSARPPPFTAKFPGGFGEVLTAASR
jgi:hypothetical protein